MRRAEFLAELIRFLPLLLVQGVGGDDIHRITRTNPARVLAAEFS